MRDRLPVAVLLAVAVAVLGGCGGSDNASVSRSADGDCLRAWNASGNADNRGEAVADQEQWRIVVSRWVVDHPANEITGQGCSYFFYTDGHWISFSGAWEKDGDLRWGIPPTERGPRRPEQHVPEPNAELQPHGTLR